MEDKYGLLLNHDALLQRNYFKQMCRLRGLKSQYRYPLNVKDTNIYGELETPYSEPQEIWCILNQNVDQKTARKMGWVVEVDTQATMISVPYDLENLRVGCRFTLPAAIDGAPDRLFKVEEMSTIQMYPASVSCKVVPDYETEVDKTEVVDFHSSNFNLLREG